MGIFNSNDYKRGYEDGYTAGFGGKDKDFTRSGISMKFAIYGGKAIDSYNQGYNEGYKKGIEDRHSKPKPQTVNIETDAAKPSISNIENTKYSKNSYSNHYSTVNTNSEIMASIQQYQVQLMKLEEMVSFLNMFKEQMEQNLNGYKARVQQMYETGMPEEVMRRFESDHIPETANLITQIKMLMDDRIIPYTNTQIEIIRMALERS
jgi:hypothetical protein